MGKIKNYLLCKSGIFITSVCTKLSTCVLNCNQINVGRNIILACKQVWCYQDQHASRSSVCETSSLFTFQFLLIILITHLVWLLRELLYLSV